MLVSEAFGGTGEVIVLEHGAGTQGILYESCHSLVRLYYGHNIS